MKIAFTALFLILVSAACKKTDSPLVPATDPPRPITQNDSLRLLSTRYIPGNTVKGAQDTFNLLFNHSVTINWIRLKSSGCLPDFKFKTTDSGRTVQFYNFLCGGLGG